MKLYLCPGHKKPRNMSKPLKWCAFLFNVKIVYTLDGAYLPHLIHLEKYYVIVCLFFISSCLSCLANGKHNKENHATKATKKTKKNEFTKIYTVRAPL